MIHGPVNMLPQSLQQPQQQIYAPRQFAQQNYLPQQPVQNYFPQHVQNFTNFTNQQPDKNNEELKKYNKFTLTVIQEGHWFYECRSWN